jgi:vancomycin resistance protein YoaR
VSYYENDSEPGLDATVFSPSVDLQFENNTPTAILIQLQVDEGKKEMSYKFYGQKDGRSVNISPVTVWDVSAPPAPHYQDDPTLPNGVVKQVDWSAWGAKAKFEYKVTSNEGALMIDEMFYSNYRPWRAVFLKGTGSL